MVCQSCGKSFNVIEREKLHPQKLIYHCSQSCANKRKQTDETKNKIRESINKIKLSKNHNECTLICEKCESEFIVPYKKRNQKTCSKSCRTSLNNIKRGKIIKTAPIKIKKEKELNKTTYIYSLEYPMGNIRYIGKSDNPRERLKNHIKEAKRRNKNHKDNWFNSLKEPPILNIIEKTTYLEWQQREIYWIKYFKNKGLDLVNGTDGGEGSNGFKCKRHTDETKLKRSKKVKEYLVSLK
jgi:hypothetical protein